MSIATRTTYLAKCDYPDCHMAYDFWGSSREGVIDDITDDEEWLCLFTRDNQPRFFCPLHLRYVQNSQHDWLTVFYDSDRPDKKTSLHALRKYYEDMSTPQPLPKLECEDTILAILTSEDTKKEQCVDVLPHDMGLRVELDTNETYYLKSGWAERCDGIYGLACGYESYGDEYHAGHVTWFEDPGRIAIMNSHVKLAVPWEEPETETTKGMLEAERKAANE